MIRQTHKIDVTDKVLGRISTEIAILLRGKNKIEYQPHMDQGDIVEISNVSNLKFTGKKIDQKIYYKYSGYPGGLKETKLRKKMEDNPEFVLRNAVYHMMPKNKLRDQMIKRLKFV
jgi:large subunit ribosomal protein L13